MLDQIIAPGNEIAFGQTEFRVNRMPWRKARDLTERVRTYIPRLKPLVIPILMKQQRGVGLTQTEAVEFFMDLFGVLDTKLVEDFQEVLFSHISFRPNPQGEFKQMMVSSDLAGDDVISLEELAFRNMGMTEIYALTLRCIYVNFQRDIEYWSQVYQKNAQADALELQEATPEDNEPEKEEGAE